MNYTKESLDSAQQCTQMQQLIDDVISSARKKGASAAEVSAGASCGFDISVRMGDVEKVEFIRDKGIGITVYFGQRKGSVNTTDTSAEAIESALDKACYIARLTGEDIYSGLAKPELMAYNFQDPKLEYVWDLDTLRAIEQAIQCEAIALEQDKRLVNSEGAGVSTHQAVSAYGNSNGFIGGYASTRHSISCSLLAASAENMERDYSYSVARNPTDLWTIETIAKDCAARTLRRLDARKMQTCKVPVIFAADVARSLLSSFFSAIRGSNLYRKSTFLLDMLHKPIFPSSVHIYERPHLPKGLASAPFDAEGVITTDKDFVSAGILQNYILSSYSARRLGMETTGNAGGLFNVFIDATLTGGLNTMLKKMDRGLLVTELMGQGVNITTGDYSRGAFGFWVENGDIQYPVHEITIAGNLKDIFLNLVAIGDDIDVRSSVHTGSILVAEMMVAGT